MFFRWLLCLLSISITKVGQHADHLVLIKKKENMARILSGILGGFEAKVGNVVGSRWRSISYIRSLPRRSRKEPSEKQLATRLKFSLASAFVYPIRSIVDVGFTDSKITDSTATANFIGQIINNAIVGSYPDLKIDYSKVIISKGGISPLKDLQITINSPSDIIISWSFTDGHFSGKGSDKVLAVLYDDLKKEYQILEDATRLSKQVKLNITDQTTSASLHVWLFCIEEKTNKVSESQYLLIKRS